MPELGPILVRVPDGGLFSCTIETVDGERRWIFEATNGTRHVGPVAVGEYTPVAIQRLVQRLVEAWRSMRPR